MRALDAAARPRDCTVASLIPNARSTVDCGAVAMTDCDVLYVVKPRFFIAVAAVFRSAVVGAYAARNCAGVRKRW